MSLVRDQHRRAMDLADQALATRRRGDLSGAVALFRQALEHEREAAELVAADGAVEPTRSVLFRSAATLALDCGEIREAERLIAMALAGNPPHEIAEELRDLLEDIRRAP
jgi:tetratricopeptide (TPR) repeat protein